jgi:hypothetical protein
MLCSGSICRWAEEYLDAYLDDLRRSPGPRSSIRRMRQRAGPLTSRQQSGVYVSPSSQLNTSYEVSNRIRRYPLLCCFQLQDLVSGFTKNRPKRAVRTVRGPGPKQSRPPRAISLSFFLNALHQHQKVSCWSTAAKSSIDSP